MNNVCGYPWCMSGDILINSHDNEDNNQRQQKIISIKRRQDMWFLTTTTTNKQTHKTDNKCSSCSNMDNDVIESKTRASYHNRIV